METGEPEEESGTKPRKLSKAKMSRIFQFLGQDNVFFYVLMQGAMSCSHLRVKGEKMSKSRGNFVTGDQVLNQHAMSRATVLPRRRW